MSAAQGNDRHSREVTRIAAASIGVGSVVLALKTAAWWMTGSVALLSDALESIVNVAAALADLNRCQHQGTPLETFPDRFLDQTGELLICSTHGARFRVRDGACVKGPCEGASLEAFAISIEGRCVYAKKRK
jgi:nitrite reductase/ring-hydroxylating ferredoxin subunit